MLDEITRLQYGTHFNVALSCAREGVDNYRQDGL
jgi:hypothetical protein